MRALWFVHAIVILCLFTAGNAFASNSCGPMFGGHKYQWETQFAKAHAIFSENLFKPGLSNFDIGKGSALWMHEGYRDYRNPHSKILRDVFGIKIVPNGKAPSIEQIVRIYERKMDEYVNQGRIKRSDVLLPGFTFVQAGSGIIWLQYGEPIPEGALAFGSVLTEERYNQMTSQGLFPVGNQRITPTGVSSFEHDFAHLTAYIEFPEYMAAVRRLGAMAHKKSYDSDGSKTYYFGEALTLVKKDKTDELLNLFPVPHGKNILEISVNELISHLRSLPKQQVLEMLLKLHKDYDYYMDSLGGSTRDYVNRSFNAIHVPFKVMVTESLIDFREDGNLDTAASMMIIFARLSQTTLQDWERAVIEPTLKPGSPLDKLFSDDEVWNWNIQKGDLRKYFYEVER